MPSVIINSNKVVDIQFNAHDTSLEKPSSGSLSQKISMPNNLQVCEEEDDQTKERKHET